MAFSQKSILAGAMALFALAASARGQGNMGNVERFSRQLEQIQRETLIQPDLQMSLDQRVFFDYGGYFTYGYLSAQDNNDDTHILNQYQIVGYASLNIDNVHQFFVRGLTGWNNFNDGDSFDGLGDEGVEPELDVWYYEFNLKRYESAYKGKEIDYNIVFKGGRDLVVWGAGLSLSQDIEGINSIVSWGGNDLTILAGVTAVQTVDWDSSRPNFDTHTRKGYYGGMLGREISGHRPYIYALSQFDYDTGDTLQTGPITTNFDYNSYYLGIGSTGPITDRLLYTVEGVYEGGNNLSNSFQQGNGPVISPIDQTRNYIQAFAADARLDYLVPDIHRTRFSAETIIASGDDDRLNTTNTFGGNAPNTPDNAYNSLGLLNTGLAFAPAVSNMLLFRVGASTFPLPDTSVLRRMQIGTDFFIYNKLDADAPIDEETKNSMFLGVEPDFYLNWQVVSDVTFIARYGIFFPSGDAFESTQPRQYIYMGVTYAF